MIQKFARMNHTKTKYTSRTCLVLLLSLILYSFAVQAKVGPLESKKYATSGEVFIKNDNEIVIENFRYNGEILKEKFCLMKITLTYYTGGGPDAYFYVGKELPIRESTGIAIPQTNIFPEGNKLSVPFSKRRENEPDRF